MRLVGVVSRRRVWLVGGIYACMGIVTMGGGVLIS